ncbi:MAG TPA: hypothetical protein VM638_04160, partial [Actinomycetota bacterium]|nr:hypothetical protein [Actinomycetota bacterium]
RGDESGFSLPLPPDAASEVRAAASAFATAAPRILACDVPPSEPLDGGADLARLRRLLAGGSGERR